MKHWVAVLVLMTGVCLAQAAWAREPIALYGPTLNVKTQARVEAMLAEANGQPPLVDLNQDWSRYSLLVLVDPPIMGPITPWGDEMSFSQKLASYYFLGGRVLLVGIPGYDQFPSTPDLRIWNGLTRYFWNTPLDAITGIMKDSDHRALFFPGPEYLGSQKDFGAILGRLFAARDELPSSVPAEDLGRAPRIELRSNSLWLDGKPLLLRGTGFLDLINQIPLSYYRERFRTYHEMDFNAVNAIAHYDLSDAKFHSILELAQEYGIYIELQVQGPMKRDDPVRKEYLFKFLRFRNDPMIIAWELCDDMFDDYYPYIARSATVIRRYDHRLPITGVFVDLRWPQRVNDWNKWKKLADFPLTYLYPMQRDPAILSTPVDIKGGLKDIARLEANTHLVWGNVFSEQFEQAHMQGYLAEAVGLQPWTEHLTPTAEQERLITYQALVSGVKGEIYFYPESLTDEGMGRNRRNELTILWHEASLVNDILAGGDAPIPLKTSDPTIEAALIKAGRESVIVLVKDERHYNRYVDQAVVKGLRVELPADIDRNAPVYRIDWPHAEKLPISGSAQKPYLSIPRFTLTSMLLLTADSAHVEAIERSMARELPKMARCAAAVLEDERLKTDVVAQLLPKDLAGESSLLVEARAADQRARTALEEGDATNAWCEARTGLIPLEEYRAQAIRAAEADADGRHASKGARVYLDIYFSLPNYAYVTRGGPPLDAGELRRRILEAQGENVWPSIDRVHN